MPARPFRAYAGSEPYVFVCYAHSDADVIYPELADLAATGVPVWYDEGIEPSSEWSDSLAHAIEGCALFLYYLSPRSASSDHCRREISFALDVGLKVLVAVLEPTTTSAGLRLSLGNRQSILRHELTSGVYLEKLRSTIDLALAGTTSSPTTAPTTQAPYPPRRRSAERRQLTVLCTDIVNASTDAWPDPEDWADAVHAYHTLCRDTVVRFEGRVAQFTSDGVVVYFGHPVAHEKDAERAVRYALALIDALPAMTAALASNQDVMPAARVSINTGPVVMEQTDPGSGELLASGLTPNLAARMLESGLTDTLLISNSTLNLVGEGFETETIGERQFQGFAQPVAVHRVIGGRSHAERSRMMAVTDTPFVGRDMEMSQLTAMSERAQANNPTFALVVGEPGIGKSRLVHEFGKQLEDMPHRWLSMECSPFEVSSPFQPLVAALRHDFGLDGADQQPQQLAAAAAACGISSPEQVAALANLLDIDGHASASNATAQRRATIEAVHQWLVRPDQLTVLLVEDVHWLDPSSLEVIGGLIQQVSSAPLLVLLTARPAFAPDIAWRGRLNTINVERLLDADVERLIAQLADHAIDEATRQLARRSDGIPLFAEELAKTRADDTHGAAAVPTTLQELLYAQLDRLGEARTTAQIASVFGREFNTDMLQAVAQIETPVLDSHINKLNETGLILPRGLASEHSYVFKHALIQELAYESMLKKQRRAVHLQIGNLLTTEHADTTGPHVPALHFSRAQDRERAAALWLQAGRNAFKRSAHTEAVDYLQRGLTEIPGIGDDDRRISQEIPLQTYLGEALSVLKGYAAQDAQLAFERARELSAGSNRIDAMFRAVSRLQSASLLNSHIDHSRALAAELQTLAASMNDARANADADTMSGVTEYAGGDFAAAARYFARAVSYHEHEHRSGTFGSIAAHADAFYINALWLLGQPDAAINHAEAALTRARSSDHAFNEAAVLNCLGAVRLLRGEVDDTLAVADTLATMASDHTFALHIGNAHCLRGAALVRAENVAQGIEELLEGIEIIRGTGQGTYATWHQPFLADAHLKVGNLDEADRVITRTLAHCEEVGVHTSSAELLRLRGQICSARRDDVAALGNIREAMELSEQQHALGWGLRAAVTYHTLARGDAESKRQLEQYYGRFDEGLDTADLRLARSTLDNTPE